MLYISTRHSHKIYLKVKKKKKQSPRKWTKNNASNWDQKRIELHLNCDGQSDSSNTVCIHRIEYIENELKKNKKKILHTL